MKRKLFFTFLFILSQSSFGQQSKIDSLLTLLKKGKEDTNKVNHLNKLSWEYINISFYDSSISLANTALKLSQQLNPSYKRGISNAYNNLGNAYSDQGDYPKALDYYLKALKIDEELQNKKGITAKLCNIGIVYHQQADYPKALDYYFKALKFAEELGNKNSVAAILGNIGIVYKDQADYPKALDYYFKALKFAEELGDKNGIGRHLGNIGIVYDNQADYPEALDYYFKALKMYEELGDKNEIAINLQNIGSLYTSTKKYTEAEKYLLDALNIDKEIGAKDFERQAEESLSELYSKTNRYQLALEANKKAMVLKDTLFSQENKKQLVRKEMNYEFDKKEATAKAEQDKKDTITAEEKRRQKIITYSVSGGLFLVLLLALFIFRGYRQKQKANKELAEKNSVIEEQKKLVEEKNKDITDSINYAKRIQEAVLIPESEVKKQFSDAFVLFKPKDIVSGDIYWFAESKYNKVLVVADCTGHGVPGGFMSMLSFAMLQETLLLEEVKTTAQALSFLDHKITETLNRNNRSYRDGMDMTLCAFSKSSNTLQFSCANRPLILIRNGELKEFSPDKFTIGGAIDNVSKTFRNQEIQIEQGDMIYLFTDGYVDQFGGAKGKKFKHKQLNEKLLAISDKPMIEQKNILEKTFGDWKGSLEQVDDILVIGIKL